MTPSGRSPSGASGVHAALIRFAIRFRGAVVALAMILLGYGVLTVMRAKYDVFPEFAPPQVSIQTEAPGLSPEQIETLVTQPVENAINGVPGVQTLRSSSIQGLSVVTVIFDPASDVYRDRQLVAERLAIAAQQLPVGTKPPAMTPLTSSSSTVLVLGLTSDTRSDPPFDAQRRTRRFPGSTRCRRLCELCRHSGVPAISPCPASPDGCSLRSGLPTS